MKKRTPQQNEKTTLPLWHWSPLVTCLRYTDKAFAQTTNLTLHCHLKSIGLESAFAAESDFDKVDAVPMTGPDQCSEWINFEVLGA